MTKRLIICFIFVSNSIAQAANVSNITASAGLMLDDNITRAQYNRDIYDDRAWVIGLSGDYSLPANEHSLLQVTVASEVWQFQNTNLSHKILSLQADYIFQPNTGYTAPWYSIYLLYGINSNDSEYRDGSFNELGLTFGKRITDATRFSAGASRQVTSADTSVFSLHSTRVYGNLDFKFDRHTLYTTLAYNSGDIISTNTPPHPASLSGVPWVNDDAAFPGLTNSWTYKLDADTWSIRLGYVHALTSNQSIDASLLRYQSSAYGGNDYDGMIANIIYFYRF